ncbi:MAG: hypothetical protein RL247_1004 [Actinomycetota bacterium]
MNARLNALATVLDVVVLVGIGIGLFFAPLTMVWAFDDGFSTDLLLSWAISVDGWMLGHGVPLTFAIPPDVATALSIGEVNRSFSADIALLGVAFLTVLWGYRIGRREGTRLYPLATWFLAVGTMVLLSFVMVFFLPAHMVTISLIDALVRPALFLALGLALAIWIGQDAPGGRALASVVPDGVLRVFRTGLVSGATAVLGMVTVSAIVVAALLLLSFAPVISLYESLQPGIWGIITLSIGQLALLPTAIVWATTWLVGPGFALGTGALVSPLGTTLQAAPALPLLGIIPQEVPQGAVMVVMVPVIVALLAGFFSASRLSPSSSGKLWIDTDLLSQPVMRAVMAAILAGLTSAGGGAVLAALTSGAAGPGRFANVGADPGQVALWWGLEASVGVFLGLVAGILSRRGR